MTPRSGEPRARRSEARRRIRSTAGAPLLAGLFAAPLLLALAGCNTDRCETEPASFELELILDDVALVNEVRSLEVTLGYAGDRFHRSYPISDELRDGRTSVAVDLAPMPDGDFDLEIEAMAMSGGSGVAFGQQTVRGRANGCNRYSVILNPGDRPDAGVREVGVDRPIGDDVGPDVGLDVGADAGIDAGDDAGDTGFNTGFDAALPDAGGMCASAADPDTLMLFDFTAPASRTATLTDVTMQHGAVARPVGRGFQFVPGPDTCGEATAFNSDGYLEVAHSEQFNLAEGSLDFWVRFEGDAPNGMQGIVSRDASGTAKPGHLTISRNCENRVVLRIQETGSPDVYRCANQPTEPGRWVHVGLNLGAPSLDMYVDGELATITSTETVPLFNCTDPVPCGAPSQRGIAGNENPWAFGSATSGSEEGLSTPSSAPLRGGVDSFRLSSTRRSF